MATSLMKRSSSCVISASQPTTSAQKSTGGKDEEILKLITEWKANATRERAWNRIQRLGLSKLKKPSEYKPEDFFPKLRNILNVKKYKTKIAVYLKPSDVQV
jgi:hypothetical protein